MENYDPEKAARVWQRVHATAAPPPETGELLALIAEAWTDAGVYLRLARRVQGRAAATLRRLGEEAQSHAAALRGIYTLTTGQKPIIRTAPPDREPLEAALRRCYQRAMKSLAAYEARAADPEYGPVFAHMAQEQRQSCQTILELIGEPQ